MNSKAKDTSNNKEKCEDLINLLAKRTGTDSRDWYLTFRAREAMQVVFEEVKKVRGAGSVMLQPFTCSTVPEAVIASGMDLEYADICKGNLSMDPEFLKESQNCHAVILQHTFGMIDSDHASEIRALADSTGILLVEDCAHCAGRTAADADGKPLADVSVHSFGVEKILPTQFGAAVWIDPDMKDRGLYEAITAHFRALPPTDANASRSVSTYITRFRILNHLPPAVKKPIRNSWISSHRFIPAVSEAELAGRTILEPSVPGDEVMSRCLDAFRNIDRNESRRSAAVESYRKALAEMPGNVKSFAIPASAMSGSAQPLLQFPVVFESNEDAMKLHDALNSAGIYNSTWGRPLLFPGVTNDQIFRFDDAVSNCHVSKECSNGIALLPTDKEPEQVSEIISIVRGSVE
jgi:dTDP-4-amino-4,6-dideoxygalactose transaminase